MSPAPTKVAGGQKVWTRGSVEQALRDYHAEYGELTAACFSTSSAKWGDRPELVERYYAGNPRDDGMAWPSLNSIKKHLGGFNDARAAIGLPPSKVGPRRAAGVARPIRDVRERRHTVVVDRKADNRLPLQELPRTSAVVQPRTTPVVQRVEVADVKLVRANERLRKQVTKTEQRMAVATERLREARARARDATARAAGGVREVKRLRARVGELQGAVKTLTAERDAALKAHQRDTDKLAMAAMAETNAAALARSQAQALQERVGELEAVVELVDRDALERAAEEVDGARARVAEARTAVREAEHVAMLATTRRRTAEARAERAERDAARAERERIAVVQATAGTAKRLTPEQVAELRSKGPAGSALLTAAIKKVGNAHAKGEREKLRDALRDVAAAAVNWSTRL